MDDKVRNVAQAIWVEMCKDVMFDGYSGVPFEEVMTRDRYLHLRGPLVRTAEAAIKACG